MNFSLKAHRKDLGTRLGIYLHPDELARWGEGVLRACGWHIPFGVKPNPIRDGYWVPAIMNRGGDRYLFLGFHTTAGPGVTFVTFAVSVENIQRQLVPWDADTESALLDAVERMDVGLGRPGWSLVKGHWVDPDQAARFRDQFGGQ